MPAWKTLSVARTARVLQADASALSNLDQAYVNRLRADVPTLGLTAELAHRLSGKRECTAISRVGDKIRTANESKSFVRQCV